MYDFTLPDVAALAAELLGPGWAADGPRIVHRHGAVMTLTPACGGAPIELYGSLGRNCMIPRDDIPPAGLPATAARVAAAAVTLSRRLYVERDALSEPGGPVLLTDDCTQLAQLAATLGTLLGPDWTPFDYYDHKALRHPGGACLILTPAPAQPGWICVDADLGICENHMTETHCLYERAGIPLFAAAMTIADEIPHRLAQALNTTCDCVETKLLTDTR